MKRRKGWRMSCDIGESTERLENELCRASFSNPSFAFPTSQLILQPFRSFTHITAHSPTFPLLQLRHSSFFNPSVALPTSQALHLRHLASRPWKYANFEYNWCNNYPVINVLINLNMRKSKCLMHIRFWNKRLKNFLWTFRICIKI